MATYGETSLVRGMAYLAEVQAAIAHNLANVDTASFKRRTPFAVESKDEFHSLLQQQLPTVRYAERTDLRPGVSRETGSRFDLAIDGPYWLRARQADGREYYTRKGQTMLDAGGTLVTHDGLRLLDQGGQPIVVGAGEEAPRDLTISPNGTLADPATGRTWGPLALVKLPRPEALVPRGNGLFTDPTGQKGTQAGDGVQQGFLEGSNVDSLEELVQMITVERTFTATQRMLANLGQMQQSLTDQMLR